MVAGFFFLLLGFVLLGCLEGIEQDLVSKGGSSSVPYQYQTKYFKQRVDHYNLVANDFYQQRYLINDSYWDHEQGPIFFYTGNEGDIEAFAQNSVRKCHKLHEMR